MRKRVTVDAGNFEFSYAAEKCPPSESDMRSCNDSYEIIFIVSGEGRCVVEGASFDVSPVTLMILRPFEFYTLQLSREVPYERYIVRFSLADLDDAISKMLLGIMDASEDSFGKYFPSEYVPREVFAIFDRFEFALALPDIVRRDYLKLLLSELVLFLSANKGEYMTHNDEELGARVIRYINEHITRNISLDDLARRFFVSKYHLCRAFKKHNGISVHGYINQKRVMYAKQLIDAGETASGAAYRVGFGDYSSFYRAYVKVLGKSPTAD